VLKQSGIEMALPSDRSEKQPAHEAVYQRLRAQILFGELAPGQPITIQGLVKALEVGMTPVREAIRRLISDGALVFKDNRRISVPILKISDVEEIVYARKSIECELAHRAAINIKTNDISNLEHIDLMLDQAIAEGDIRGYLVHNYSFHNALYRHAEAPILADLAERLWLRFGPSLRMVCGRLGTQSVPDRHKDILAALHKHDGEVAALAMERDVVQGMEQIMEGLTEAS